MPAASASDRRTELPDVVDQGALVIGTTAPGSRVQYRGRMLRVDGMGRFVFGVGRDEAGPLTIDIVWPDGAREIVNLSVHARRWDIEHVHGLPPQTVTPDPAIAERIAREQAQVAKARERDDDRTDFVHGFVRPIEGGRISGVYGSQRILNGEPRSPHYGLDIAVPTGTPVHAPADGVVTFADADLYLTGGTVLIDHGHGLTSSFLHLSRLDVSEGAQVRHGEVIGAVGATGRASGPHLHWGFNWFDVRIDPALLPAPDESANR